MKANHNYGTSDIRLYGVVSNIKNSKNESKSQHITVLDGEDVCCIKYQEFKE